MIASGTGTAASIGQFAAGKTGTTTNYGDAWFVGFDSKYTVAVWVGYPNKLVPMTTDFNGGPVFGGTFPALIWKDFMLAAIALEKKNHGHATALVHAVFDQRPTSTSPATARRRRRPRQPRTAEDDTTDTKAPATAAPAPATKAPASRTTPPQRHPTPAPPPNRQPTGGGGGGTSSGGVGAG